MAEQLSQASPDLLRNMIQPFAEALMSADADAVCGAGPERSNTRNGYQPGLGHQGRVDRAGHPEVAGGKLLPGVAAGAAPAGRVRPDQRGRHVLLLGVSTRRMEKLVESLGFEFRRGWSRSCC
jgi:putative transposase